MSTETTKKKIKIDNGTNFAKVYTDKAIDAKMPTDLQATATSLSLLAGATKVGSGINLSGFEYDEATKTLKASGGGGGGVSPCLNLVDFSGENPVARTTITKEEKTNFDKGLYNSVIYFDTSLGESGFYSMNFPEPLITLEGEGSFSIFNFTMDESGESFSITSSSVYGIEVGEKNADGTYPISIYKRVEAKFGGGNSSSPSTSIAFKDVTVSELSDYAGKFENLHVTDLKATLNVGGNSVETTGVYFVGTINGTNLIGTAWVNFEGDYLILGSGTFLNSNGTIKNGACALGGVLNAVSVGKISMPGVYGSFESSFGKELFDNYLDDGDSLYVGKVTIEEGTSKRIVDCIAYTGVAKSDATGDETWGYLTGYFDGVGYGRIAFKKGSDGNPAFKSFTTWLPPVTSTSDGKALIVTEGNAKWTNIPRYKHVVNLTAKSGGNTTLSAIFTGSNSSNLPIDSYQDLTKLFAGETLELHGKVIVNGEVKDTKYLDLHGGGINADNIAYWQGGATDPLALVTINLDQFAGLTLADDVCLPK